MHVEVNIALNFVISYLYNKLPRRRVDLFGIELEKGLKKKFQGHWYPYQPVKGSGFRCIRFNGETIDPVVTNAAENVGINLEEVKEYLPNELTLWIDPNEVSYRIGEKGQIKSLYSNKNIEDNTENEDIEIQITNRGFNPEAQSFEPIDRLSASLGTLIMYNNSEGLSAVSSSSWGGSLSTSPLGGPSFPSAFGTSLPQSTILPKRQAGIPMFTTATFAKTKFGSTKLKSNAKRPTCLSPTEFGNVLRRKNLSNSLQHPAIITPPRSRSLSPGDPMFEFFLDQQQRILHNQQQYQLQQQFQQQQQLNLQQQSNRLSIPSNPLFMDNSSPPITVSLHDMFSGQSHLQSEGHSSLSPAPSILDSSQPHLASVMSNTVSIDQHSKGQGHSAISSVQICPESQTTVFEGLDINNSSSQCHQLLLAS